MKTQRGYCSFQRFNLKLKILCPTYHCSSQELRPTLRRQSSFIVDNESLSNFVTQTATVDKSSPESMDIFFFGTLDLKHLTL